MRLRTWGLLGLLWVTPAVAQEAGQNPAAEKGPAAEKTPEADEASDETEDDTAEESVTGKKPPPLPSEPKAVHASVQRLQQIAKEKEAEDKPYPATTYLGAETLKLDPQYVFEVQRGVELIFRRDYNGARDHFERLDDAYPGTGVQEVVDVMVWQALMLENFDFRFDKQYWTSSGKAREALGAAMKQEGAEGWEHLLMCGVSGIEAIHTMRQSQYTKALSLAFEAMGHLKEARANAPEFPDLLLADGMYNYWRTVVTLNSKVLPDFGDHRVKGIEQVKAVEESGVFLGPAATLSMAFTWLEEGHNKKALASCQKNRRAYPKSVINNLVTGSTYIYLKQYDNALTVFDEILAVDPKNKRVRYWRGVAYLKKGEPDKAIAELNTYLGFEYLEKYQRAAAYWRLGVAQQRKKDWAAAEKAFNEAIRIDKHKMAKKSLDRQKERRKEGKISW